MSSERNAHSLMRTLWRAGIVLLWVAVGILLFITFKNRPPQTKPPTEPNQQLVEPIVLKPQPDQETPNDSSLPQWNPEGIDDFHLTEASGRQISKQDLLGKPWAVCFIFRQCAGPCPRVSAAMRTELQDRLKDVDFRLVTITVDPKNDTPPLLEQYAEFFSADRNKWWFLTGDQTEIYRLIRDSFGMPVKEVTGPDRKPGYQIIHSSNVMHVDAHGVVKGKYNALVESDMAELRKAIQQEAALIAQNVSAKTPQPVIAPRP